MWAITRQWDNRAVLGQFRVSLTLRPALDVAAVDLEVLVDTGAGYSVVPRPLLDGLGYQPVRTQRVVLADGRIEEWPLSQVVVECQGRRTPTPMLMGPPDGPALLGATTLEELGLGVDPLNRRLVPVDLYLARAGWRQPPRYAARIRGSAASSPLAPATTTRPVSST